LPSRYTIALLAFLPAVAQATEVEFEGAYRARARVFDTLSLDRTLDDSERLAALIQHRLWLRPRFLLSDQVALNVDFKGLDNVVWGERSLVPASGVSTAAPTFGWDLTAPIVDPNDTEADGASALQDFTLWRAWGEIHSDVGSFRFGRMPLHWGSGIWQNDGLSVGSHFADYGDTADRVEWNYLVIDQFSVRLAADVNTEGFVNEIDDITAFTAALAYQNETVAAGINSQLQHRGGSGEKEARFNLFTIDLAASAELGQLVVETENVGQFGGGRWDETFDDVNIAAFGSMTGIELHLDPIQLRVEGGIATGDDTLGDQNLRSFTFDRDYSVGVMLFEQNLPTLAAALATTANGNRSLDQALTGNAISNAIYLKPQVSYSLLDGFAVNAAWLAARTAKVPNSFGGRTSYGMELQAGARYTGIEHVDFSFTYGLFLPGSYYKTLPDETYTEFAAPANGFQLSTRIHF
jgi:hypothetical protein